MALKLVTTNKSLIINNPVAIKKGINKEKQDALSVEQKKRARVIHTDARIISGSVISGR